LFAFMMHCSCVVALHNRFAPKELLGGPEAASIVASKPDQRHNSTPHGFVVVKSKVPLACGSFSLDWPHGCGESTQDELWHTPEPLGIIPSVTCPLSRGLWLQASAMRTRSASIRAPNFRIAAARLIFTVISLKPSSPPPACSYCRLSRASWPS
jgi:hypothetical protein